MPSASNTESDEEPMSPTVLAKSGDTTAEEANGCDYAPAVLAELAKARVLPFAEAEKKYLAEAQEHRLQVDALAEKSRLLKEGAERLGDAPGAADLLKKAEELDKRIRRHEKKEATAIQKAEKAKMNREEAEENAKLLVESAEKLRPKKVLAEEVRRVVYDMLIVFLPILLALLVAAYFLGHW